MKEEKFAPSSESLLSEEQERLARRESAILANRSQVYWLAKRVKVSDEVYQELVQEGLSALCRAADNFSHDIDSHFSTFAYYKIRSAMLRHLEERQALYTYAKGNWQDDIEEASALGAAGEVEVIRSFMLQKSQSRMRFQEKILLVARLLVSKLKSASLQLLPRRWRA